MEHQQFSFDNAFQGFHPMDSPYDGHVSFVDFVPPRGQVSDLDLTNHRSLNQSMVPRGHALMERFLTEKQRQPLFFTMPQAQPLTLAPPVPSLPPAASTYRHASPSTSHDPSSCGSALSPGTDADPFIDPMPSTPPDLTMFPSCQSAPFDVFKASSLSQMFLSGVGGFPEDNYSCVTLSQISPADEASGPWKEPSALSSFESPHPSYIFASEDSSSLPTEAACLQSSIERCCDRASTPAELGVIKEEMHMPAQHLFAENVAAAYPTPSVKDSEVSDAEIDTDSPTSEVDEDEDEYQPEFHVESSDLMRRSPRKNKRDAAATLENSPKRTRTASSASQTARRLPPSTNSAKAISVCKECALAFKDEPTLEMHVKKQHTRPFACVFNFAGCTSNFASKNEWKRHVASQHLVLHYWLCDMGVCAHNKNTLSPSKPRKGRGRGARVATEQTLSLEPTGPPLPNGAIFNRKDLYTQHIRRMHAPTEAGAKSTRASRPYNNSAGNADAASSHWDNQVKALQSQAIRERCQLPEYMKCPALHCTAAFSGADAWDQRMEHVARHLEKAALNQEAPVVFGGPTDMTLMDWATRPDVAVVKHVGSGHWQLNKPLQAASEGRGVGRKRDLSSTAFPSTSASSSVAGSSIMSYSIREFSAGTSVKSETFMDEGDEDAEGEDE